MEEVFLLVSEVRTPQERGLAWGQLECLQLKASLPVESQTEGGSAGDGGSTEDRRKGIYIVQIKVKTKNWRLENGDSRTSRQICRR